jgi:hypothetical protein
MSAFQSNGPGDDSWQAEQVSDQALTARLSPMVVGVYRGQRLLQYLTQTLSEISNPEKALLIGTIFGSLKQEEMQLAVLYNEFDVLAAKKAGPNPVTHYERNYIIHILQQNLPQDNFTKAAVNTAQVSVGRIMNAAGAAARLNEAQRGELSASLWSTLDEWTQEGCIFDQLTKVRDNLPDGNRYESDGTLLSIERVLLVVARLWMDARETTQASE